VERKTSEYFDLSVLLEQDDLNIRSFANRFALSVYDYFSMLSELINLMPDVLNAIDKFASRNGDKDACKSLDSLAALLKKLDCDKCISAVYTIIDAYGKGNYRLAALYAERIKYELKSFCMQIMTAKTDSVPGFMQNEKEDILSLQECIRYLDAEAANRKLLILAVDDSPVMLKTVSSVLSDSYKVLTLSKPTELEKVLHKLAPDLFLLDYQMPEINGFELVPIIRSFDRHKATPIIFLTSEGTIDNLTAAFALGACDFAVKPFKPDILREKIAKHIVRKK